MCGSQLHIDPARDRSMSHSFNGECKRVKKSRLTMPMLMLQQCKSLYSPTIEIHFMQQTPYMRCVWRAGSNIEWAPHPTNSHTHTHTWHIQIGHKYKKYYSIYINPVCVIDVFVARTNPVQNRRNFECQFSQLYALCICTKPITIHDRPTDPTVCCVCKCNMTVHHKNRLNQITSRT